MPKGIPGSRPLCSLEGCGLPHAARGFCGKHVKVAYRQGLSLLQPERRTCSAEDCDAPYYCRNLCTKHYQRWQRTGTTDDPQPSARRCEMSDCGNPHEARGLCKMHYERWQKHADPNRVVKPPRHGAHSGRWTGDDASYRAVHNRVRALYGRPPKYQCRSCPKQAYDWAYDHLDPEERRDEQGSPYSLDPTHYLPLCRSCHKYHDWAFAPERK